jgi:hypothetical protein
MRLEVIRQRAQYALEHVHRFLVLPLFQEGLTEESVRFQILWEMLQNVAAMPDHFLKGLLIEQNFHTVQIRPQRGVSHIARSTRFVLSVNLLASAGTLMADQSGDSSRQTIVVDQGRPSPPDAYPCDAPHTEHYATVSNFVQTARGSSLPLYASTSVALIAKIGMSEINLIWNSYTIR